MNRKGYLSFKREFGRPLAELSIDGQVVAIGGVSEIAREIRKQDIKFVQLDNGISFLVPTTSKTLLEVCQHPSQDDFFLYRLISECVW